MYCEGSSFPCQVAKKYRRNRLHNLGRMSDPIRDSYTQLQDLYDSSTKTQEIQDSFAAKRQGILDSFSTKLAGIRDSSAKRQGLLDSFSVKPGSDYQTTPVIIGHGRSCIFDRCLIIDIAQYMDNEETTFYTTGFWFQEIQVR